ncbi:MAG: hypothetical protein ACYSUK_05840 [Planctomycetota bacterium]|jgi:hypothetical protein
MISGVNKENEFWIKEEVIIGCSETRNELMHSLGKRFEPIDFIVFLLLLVCTFGIIHNGLIIAGPGGGIGLIFSPAVILGLVSLLGLSLPIYNHQLLLLHIVFTCSLSKLWLRMGDLIALLLFKIRRLTLCVCEVF